MTSLRRAIDEAAATLAGAGVGSPRVDAELLAAHAAGVDRGRLIWHEPDGSFFPRYRALVAERARRIPLQHVTATAAFGPLRLEVGPGVFVPRPETEALLEWALAVPLPPDPVIVDLCTGSGALALALATARPDATVVAVDDSPTALAYARRNAEGTRVRLVAADVTAPGLLDDLDGRVDLLVANPPYVPDGAVLEPEVAEHDPPRAVFGGPDGMRVIEPLVSAAARLLRAGGFLAVEHDDTTAAATVAVVAGTVVAGTGAFDHVVAHPDLAGRPRFVTAHRKG